MKKINSLTLDENEIITSYDVSALFTSIPPDDAIQVVRNCLIKDVNLNERTDLSVEQIVKLVTLCSKTTYFSYNGQFYSQQFGCAMGSSVSPIVVNLYMEAFEQSVLKDYPGKAPKLWLRYVDDTFVVKQKWADPFFKLLTAWIHTLNSLKKSVVTTN